MEIPLWHTNKNPTTLVSGELSSMEIHLHACLTIRRCEFQENLVVWKFCVVIVVTAPAAGFRRT